MPAWPFPHPHDSVKKPLFGSINSRLLLVLRFVAIQDRGFLGFQNDFDAAVFLVTEGLVSEWRLLRPELMRDHKGWIEGAFFELI